MPPKKKQRMLFHSSDVIRSGLQKSHGGKRILLKASLIYSKGNIPAGEKDYLFQYSIRTINSDCSTSIIDFDERYVVEGGHEFLNYPNIDPGDEEPSIPNYQLESIIDDHELYNTHLGRGNKIKNDIMEARRVEDETLKVWAVDDLMDIMKKMGEQAKAYSLLMLEFEPHSALEHHTMTSGPNQGKVNIKQIWKHKHSSYTFMWHRQFGKPAFQTDRLWKAARAIISKNADGHERLSLILKYSKKTCNLYIEDLTHRLQLDASNLPPALSRHVILNPIFGPKSRIIGSGLMSDTQHYRGRACE